MLSWIVAENRNGSSVTTAIACRRLCSSTERTSAPSIRTEPGADLVQPGEEGHERGLAGAHRAHERDRPARLDFQIDVAQRRLGGAVEGQAHVAERHPTRPVGQRRRVLRAGDPRRAVEHLEDTGARGGRALRGAEHVPERSHRRDQHQQVRVERGERADRQRSVDHVAAADQQDQRQAQVRKEADQRRVAGLDPRRVHLLVEHPRHRMLEAVELALLLRERLDHANAGHVLLGVRGQLGDSLLGLLERGPRAAPVHPRDHDHERHRRQRQRRQRGLEREHRHRGERDRDDRLGDEDQAVPEEEADRLQVHRGAGHQLPGLLAVEERELQRLQRRIQPLAQVDLDGQRHPTGDQAPRGAQRQPCQAGDDDRDRPDDQLVAVAVADRVDRASREVRDQHGGAHRAEGERERPGDGSLVRMQEAEESPEYKHTSFSIVGRREACRAAGEGPFTARFAGGSWSSPSVLGGHRHRPSVAAGIGATRRLRRRAR